MSSGVIELFYMLMSFKVNCIFFSVGMLILAHDTYLISKPEYKRPVFVYGDTTIGMLLFFVLCFCIPFLNIFLCVCCIPNFCKFLDMSVGEIIKSNKK